MTAEDIETTTIGNAKAIAELTIIARQTSKDVDKLINHLDTVPATRIISMEKRLKFLEDKSEKMVSSSVLRWAYSGTVMTLITISYFLFLFVSENKDSIAALDRTVASTKTKNHERYNSIKERMDNYKVKFDHGVVAREVAKQIEATK
jgi:predicted PurR-regulated permease PerM